MAVFGWFMEACESCFKPEDDSSPVAEVEEATAPVVSEVEAVDSSHLQATGRTVACRDSETTQAIDDLSFWGRFRDSDGRTDRNAGFDAYMRLLEQGQCTVIPEGGRVRITQPNPDSGQSEARVDGETGRWIIIDRMFERVQ